MKNCVLSIGLKSAFLASATIVLPAPLLAQTATVFHFDMPAQPLDRALRQVARKTGAQIMFSTDQVSGLTSPRLQGDMGAEEAVRRLIAGTDLTAEKSASAIVIKGKARIAATDAQSDAPASSEIIVTGTRIRGAATASPTTTLTQADVRRAGQSNLGDAVRSLPQNFAGGQNPAVAMGAGGAPENINVGSGSTINLRGIGQDATLTLINGHRVAYNAAYQGVDVSAIPLIAIDRMEIVTDGSSALYGSDAVGGVANIILRRDFDGFWTSARLGKATDGGDFQQQYGAVGGARWGSGGFMAAYDFGRDTQVTAAQRSYTSTINPTQTLIPYLRHHSVLFSAHQDILPDFEFSIDGIFNDRRSNSITPVNPTGTYLDYGLTSYNHSTSYSIAPSLKYRFAGSWQATLLGVYGNDKTRYGSNVYYLGQNISPTEGCYCNDFKNVEASAEGPLMSLPGGSARLAFGGGYRENGFHAYRTIGATQAVDVHQGVYYAYGEIYLPLVSEAQNIPGISALTLSGAVRYEAYTGSDRLATPKFGLVYTPVRGLQLKGTWGKSFRAPTLYEQHTVQYSYLYTAAAVGGSSYPADSTAIVLGGANSNLKSERAESWTASAVIDPAIWPGFHAEISYYRVNYKDRVVTPISSRSSALSNQAYANLVEYTPSASDVANATSEPYSFGNLAGVALDPSKVIAIIDNRYRNIARQIIQGVDVSVRYRLSSVSSGNFTVLGNVTYLDSKERFAPDLSDVDSSGVIFYPPHVRGRGGLLWDKGSISLSSFLNYTGGVRDNRQTPSARVKSMTTADFTAQYKIDSNVPFFANSEILLAVQNITNTKPDTIRTTASYYVPYDSTNYSAVGRFVSLAISKHW